MMDIDRRRYGVELELSIGALYYRLVRQELNGWYLQLVNQHIERKEKESLHQVYFQSRSSLSRGSSNDNCQNCFLMNYFNAFIFPP